MPSLLTKKAPSLEEREAAAQKRLIEAEREMRAAKVALREKEIAHGIAMAEVLGIRCQQREAIVAAAESKKLVECNKRKLGKGNPNGDSDSD